MPSVSILFASGSGHTEYVCGVVADSLKKSGHTVFLTRAEAATAEDLLKGDFLILASGTWNTGGTEGQLHPFMYEFVFKKAKDADLKRKRCSHIALGDERYYFTARAGEYLRKYLQDHNGDYSVDPLTIVNEPYGQEKKMKGWAQMLCTSLVRSH